MNTLLQSGEQQHDPYAQGKRQDQGGRKQEEQA